MQLLLCWVLGAVLVGPIMSDVEHPNTDYLSIGLRILRLENIIQCLLLKYLYLGKGIGISDGFKQLADYIFGNNILNKDIHDCSSNAEVSKIAMTAPVMQKPNNGNWTVHFVMPSEYSMTNIPKPNNKDVILKNIPEKQ